MRNCYLHSGRVSGETFTFALMVCLLLPVGGVKGVHMNIKHVVVAASVAAVFLAGAAIEAQEAAGGASSSMPATSNQTQGTSSGSAKTSTKEKHMSGALVDIGCMSKALGGSNGAPAAPNPAASSAPPGASNFVETGGQAPGGAGGGQTPGSGPGGPGAGSPSSPGASGMPQPSAGGMSPEEQARQARAERIDNAAKQCTPTGQTQVFGLEKGDGEVVQFDPAGNAKAKDAIKDANIEQGKKLKAKVSGTVESENMVKVDSVEVKGKGKHS